MYLKRYRPLYEAPTAGARGHRGAQSEAPLAYYDCGPVPIADANGVAPSHAAVGATFADDELALGALISRKQSTASRQAAEWAAACNAQKR
jgi:hypothetical protein